MSQRALDMLHFTLPHVFRWPWPFALAIRKFVLIKRAVIGTSNDVQQHCIAREKGFLASQQMTRPN